MAELLVKYNGYKHRVKVIHHQLFSLSAFQVQEKIKSCPPHAGTNCAARVVSPNTARAFFFFLQSTFAGLTN